MSILTDFVLLHQPLVTILHICMATGSYAKLNRVQRAFVTPSHAQQHVELLG